MDVLAQMACNTGYSVCVKMSTTVAASNKQGDVKLLSFGLGGSNNLVIDVSIAATAIAIAQLKRTP